MPRPKKTPAQADEGSTRTTIFLPKVMDENLECLALTTGEAKSVLMRQALVDLLKKHGLEAYRRPQVSIRYEDQAR
jgi:hypothetical protein